MTGFETYLKTYSHLTDVEIAQITAAAIPTSLRKNELLLQQGQICRHKTFVVKGLLRNYGIVDDGSEHILQFSPENSWTLDAESYDRQLPAEFNIAAVEPSEILLWTKAEFERLLAEIPALTELSRQLITRSSYSNRQRLFAALSASPEEKYRNFVTEYPDLLARVPLHMIASYLGISLKTLTRIRHAQLHK